MESNGCTFIPMTVPCCFRRLARFPWLNRSNVPETPAACFATLFVLMVLVSSAACSWARTARATETATLVETATYIPCGNGCPLTLEPARAFCFKQGDQFMVAEGRSYLHEGKFTSFDELTGKQLSIRSSRRSLWIRPPDRGEVRLARGSLFEGFKISACMAEVHRPILQHAGASRRPVRVPAHAIAIAGPEKGEFRPLFLWFEQPQSIAASGTKAANRPLRIGIARAPWMERRSRQTSHSIRFSARLEGWFFNPARCCNMTTADAPTACSTVPAKCAARSLLPRRKRNPKAPATWAADCGQSNPACR